MRGARGNPGSYRDRLRVGELRVIYTLDRETQTYVILEVLKRGKDTYD